MLTASKNESEAKKAIDTIRADCPTAKGNTIFFLIN